MAQAADINLALAAGFELIQAHRAVAWICWLPKLVVAKVLLMHPSVDLSPPAGSRH